MGKIHPTKILRSNKGEVLENLAILRQEELLQDGESFYRVNKIVPVITRAIVTANFVTQK